MSKTRRFLFTAGIVLAMAFMLSCFPDGGEGGSNIGTCGGKEYDTTVYFCERGELAGSCRGQTYYPEYQNCENGEIREGAAISSSSSSGPLPSSSSIAPGNSSGSYGSVTHGGQAYKTVAIGTQTWMAENLNYAVAGSKCYGEGGPVYDWDEDGYIEKTLSNAEVQANCATYGRLYDWETAMTVCPAGWHLPSNADWDKLFRFVDGDTGTESPYKSRTAGKHLKATSGWNWNDYDGISGNGTDAHGFSALPGGYGGSDGSFDGVGYGGIWWSSNEEVATEAYNRDMRYSRERADWGDDDKSLLFSVRCGKD